MKSQKHVVGLGATVQCRCGKENKVNNLINHMDKQGYAFCPGCQEHLVFNDWGKLWLVGQGAIIVSL